MNKKYEIPTIVMLTWNGIEDTKKAICSIIATTLKRKFIFVDNGSTDDTINFLESIPGSKIIKTQCGFAQAVNKGLEACETKYPIVCNNDIIVRDSWCSNLLLAMKSNPIMKVIATTTNNCGQGLQWYPFKECVKPAVIQAPDINMVCFAIDREYWNNNKLDENYISGVEDVDYCWNIRKKEFKVGVCLASFVEHTGSQTVDREFKDYNSNLSNGWKYFAKKWKSDGGLIRANEYFKFENPEKILEEKK